MTDITYPVPCSRCGETIRCADDDFGITSSGQPVDGSDAPVCSVCWVAAVFGPSEKKDE